MKNMSDINYFYDLVYKYTYISYNISIFVVKRERVKSMDYIKKIENIIEKQNGIVLSSDLNKDKIPRSYLAMMLDQDKLERIYRGIYILPGAIEDEMYIMQKKYPTLIYSHETALFLHGLSDRTPFEYSATVASGYKVVENINESFKIYYIKNNLHLMGTTKIKNNFGNMIKVYNIERTICDILRSRNRIDIQILSDALKRVVKIKPLNYMLLSEYAKEFNVENILNTYMEVLL